MQDLFGDTIRENAGKVVGRNPLKKRERPSLEFLWFVVKEMKPTTFTEPKHLPFAFMHIAMSYGYESDEIESELRSVGVSRLIHRSSIEYGASLAKNEIRWIEIFAAIEQIIENSST